MFVMVLERINGSIEREDGDKVTSVPDRYTIFLEKISDIDRVYDLIKGDENFILVSDSAAVLVVANPLSSKLDNNELEIRSEK